MLLFGSALQPAFPGCLSVCVLLCSPGASDALWRRLHGISLVVRLCWSQQFCLSSELAEVFALLCLPSSPVSVRALADCCEGCVTWLPYGSYLCIRS